MTAPPEGAEHDDLQRRIDDLRGFEREYRGRLRAHLHTLLIALERPRPHSMKVTAEWTELRPGLRARVTSAGGQGKDAYAWITVEDCDV